MKIFKDLKKELLTNGELKDIIEQDQVDVDSQALGFENLTFDDISADYKDKLKAEEDSQIMSPELKSKLALKYFRIESGWRDAFLDSRGTLTATYWYDESTSKHGIVNLKVTHD